MDWRYRDMPAAAVIALKRSSFHVIPVSILWLMAYVLGLLIEYERVADFVVLQAVLVVVWIADLIISVTWGIVLGGIFTGHFYTALDELNQPEPSA